MVRGCGMRQVYLSFVTASDFWKAGAVASEMYHVRGSLNRQLIFEVLSCFTIDRYLMK